MASNSLQTAHKKILGELERYKLLVESVQDYAIFFMDINGYIQTWNVGAQRAKGYSSEEIIGKHFSVFYAYPDIADGKPQQMLEIAKRIGRVEDEDWRVRKDGSTFWANVVITALRNEEGELQGFAKVTRNLTERKEHEDSLRKANIILKKQQEELEKLNESKDEFISLASHQLRTPATAVKQLLGMALEGFAGPVPDNLLGIIQKSYESNERQIMIVNNLLRVAQIDSGRITLHTKAYDINEVVESLFDEYKDVISERGQSLTMQLSEQPILGLIDARYFRMALENILDNASKYNNDGGQIQIEISYRPDYACVSIVDTGIGITDAHIPRLFEKFYRITSDASHDIAGTGLGLYWCDKVIGLHRGKIEVESKLGNGTTFHILVPIGDTDA